MAETTDYIDVVTRASELGLELPEGVVFLPRGFATVTTAGELLNESDAIDLVKLLHSEGVTAGTTTLDGQKLSTISEHDVLVHLPVVLLQAVSPLAVSLMVDVLGNYIYARIAGIFDKPRVKVEFVVQKKPGTYKSVRYEGSVEGLSELRDAILEVAKDE
jgi:hypothetical protein